MVPAEPSLILVVDDDPHYADLLKDVFTLEGLRVEVCTSGRRAVDMAALLHPDLVILDLSLDDGFDGIMVGRRLRSGSDVPILFLTGTADPSAHLEAFHVGADDVVIKGGTMVELAARIQALLRRGHHAQRAEVDDVVVDLDRHVAQRNGADLHLTPIEFDLLAVLVRHRSRVVMLEDLGAEVWRSRDISANLVQAHVSSLRKKLERHGDRVIHTVRGAGYTVRV